MPPRLVKPEDAAPAAQAEALRAMVEEAIQAGAQVALLVYETPDRVVWRSAPGPRSVAVAYGLNGFLAARLEEVVTPATGGEPDGAA